MQRRLVLASLVIIVAISVVAVAFLWVFAPKPDVPSIRIPNNPAADFKLVDQYGRPFSLSQNATGKVVLLFFGYSHCPDLCPATMLKYAQLEEQLGPDASKVTMILITTDPWRDSPPVLKEWLSEFSPNIVGLTGSVSQVSEVWRAYGVLAEPISANGTSVLDPAESPEYLENHSAYIIGTNADHIEMVALTPEMSINDYLNGVRYLLSES
jgi:protein SCO1/2